MPISVPPPVAVPIGIPPVVTRPLNIALSLSGGGAKGAFEVGALAYLYSRGFFAKTICGSSVGAVNALQLAHGGTAETQAQNHTILVAFWKALSWSNAFYAETPFLTNVKDLFSSLASMRIDALFPISLVVFPAVATALVANEAEVLTVKAATIYDEAMSAQGLYTLAPLRPMIASALNPGAVHTSGVNLRLCTVCLESGQVQFVDQNGVLLDRQLNPLGANFGLNPACQSKADAYDAALAAQQAITSDDQVHEPGPVDRSAYLTKLATARLQVDTARKDLLACKASHPATPQPVSLLDATIASSSIPVIFTPVAMGGQHYVDGGIRVVQPTEAAVLAAPDAIVAINAGPVRVNPQGGFGTANLITIAQRAVFDLLLEEAEERQAELTRKSGVPLFLITPRVDVHDTLEQDPGLLDINMDYGYMCSADIANEMNWSAGIPVVPTRSPVPFSIIGRSDPTDPTLAALADAITKLRMACWNLEFQVAGYAVNPVKGSPSVHLQAVPSPEALDNLRLMKTLLQILTLTRSELGGAVPPAAAQWCNAYERHDFAMIGTPWAQFDSASGSRPPSTPGTALVVRDQTQQVYLLNPPDRSLVNNLQAVGPPAMDVQNEWVEAIPLGSPIN